MLFAEPVDRRVARDLADPRRLRVSNTVRAPTRLATASDPASPPHRNDVIRTDILTHGRRKYGAGGVLSRFHVRHRAIAVPGRLENRD
jgi:hypothetical protein